MKNNTEIKYNERAWAIDVISEINIFCSKNNSVIKKAGGESTLKNKKKSLFPDVLIYGDEFSGSIIHGWELKMPDTPINDTEFIDNAILKASLLNANSFLLWNVKEAVFYLKNNDKFEVYKTWSIVGIVNRNDVKENEKLWQELLIEILQFISDFFNNKKYQVINLADFSSNIYENTLNKFKAHLANIFKDVSKSNYEFEIEILEWIEENKSDKEYKNKSNYEILAEFSILSWLNKFVFAHYLKTFNSDADIIELINIDSDLEYVVGIFSKITNKCDFMNIFAPSLTDKYIDNYFLDYLLEFNEVLKGFRLDKIEPSHLHQVIDNATSYSRKKIAGQFSTPPNLAYYLTAITVKNRKGNTLDACCGSGTIAKAIYQIKRESDISPADSLNTIWASDKFSYPLQLCSIALSDPLAMGNLVQVFKADVFDLVIGQKLFFVDPFFAGEVVRELPKMDSVVSNLPFVRFESIEVLNDKINEHQEGDNIQLSGKSDLYAYVLFKIYSLIQENGRIGIIISNSWLSTEWGNYFRLEIIKRFKILRIVCSKNGKWFNNADVVTTLLILEKLGDNNQDKIDFITTNTKIHDWDREVLDEMIKSTISNKLKSTHISKQSYDLKEIEFINNFGISWNALFSDFSWFNGISDKLVKLSEFIEVSRGERRGWDELFYPEKSHQIESEYIKPVLISSRNLSDTLIGTAKGEAFCCSDSLEKLQEKNHKGALNWIKKFEKLHNGVGKPLPKVLARTNHYWYEMKPDTLADMVISMNPDKKICVYRLNERSFVNQRLISFRVKDGLKTDILHALLNSSIGLLYIESIGFGRGLGALDLNATTIKNNFHILNLNVISDDDKKSILTKFNPLLNRKIFELPKELEQKDRIEFDKEVLRVFDIKIDLSIIYETILSIYRIRQTVRD